MILPVGTRIYHEKGGPGTIIGGHMPRAGYRVRLDEKRYSFSPDTFVARPIYLTPLDPKLRAKWESGWPPFVDRSWAKEI